MHEPNIYRQVHPRRERGASYPPPGGTIRRAWVRSVYLQDKTACFLPHSRLFRAAKFYFKSAGLKLQF